MMETVGTLAPGEPNRRVDEAGGADGRRGSGRPGQAHSLRPPTPDDAAPIADWHPLPTTEVVAWWSVPDVEPWAMVGPDGELIAYGELWVDAEEDEVELARLIVDPALRGRGIGKQLVHALIALAQTKGMTTTMLRVQPDNDIAIRCYLACGFETLGAEESAEWNKGQRQVWTWMRLGAH